MLTANGRPESIAEATTLGATEYLKKPFTPEHLLRTVASCMPRPTKRPEPEVPSPSSTLSRIKHPYLHNEEGAPLIPRLMEDCC
ncbi:MAG: hypothetical protein CV090_02720 [Nitrospira sp. WS238]|nr:hypothetical protein [Nitrospira sp. WS238]